MAAQIDKRELNEPDKLQVLFLKMRMFVQKHRSRIYLGAGIFAAIVVFSGGFYMYRLSVEANAGKMYIKVFENAMKVGSPAGDNAAIKGYKELIAQYPSSDAAVLAYYRLGNLYFNQKEIDAATKAYEDFVQKAAPESDLLPLAYSGLGGCYEVKKNFTKALEQYEKALKTAAASSFESMNFSDMGRIYEAMNNPAKAVEYYRKALAKTTDPLVTIYLKRKIATLG